MTTEGFVRWVLDRAFVTQSDSPRNIGDVEGALPRELRITAEARGLERLGGTGQGSEAGGFGIAGELAGEGGEIPKVSGGFRVLQHIDALGETNHEMIEGFAGLGVVPAGRKDRLGKFGTHSRHVSDHTRGN